MLGETGRVQSPVGRWGFVGAAPAPWRQTRLRCVAHTKARTCQGKETGGFRSTKPSYPFRVSEGGTGGEPVSPNCAAQALRMEASGDTEPKDKLSIQTPRTARREGERWQGWRRERWQRWRGTREEQKERRRKPRGEQKATMNLNHITKHGVVVISVISRITKYL